jgi:hypothetical protein
MFRLTHGEMPCAFVLDGFLELRPRDSESGMGFGSDELWMIRPEPFLSKKSYAKNINPLRVH